MVLLWWLHPPLLWCHGFVLLYSSASAGNTMFETGSAHSYRLSSTVTLNEATDRKGKDVGYQIQGDVIVAVVWENPQERNDKLLQVEVRNSFCLSNESHVLHGSFDEKTVTVEETPLPPIFGIQIST